MPSAADRMEFTPPKPAGSLRALMLAVIAHGLLLLALTSGLHWKRESQDMAAEAELWASVPQQAAPKAVETPPPPPPKPVVREEPKPEPRATEADIAVEREKQRRAAEAKRQQELEQARERREKLEAQRKLEEQKKQEAQKLAAENRRKEAEARERREEQEARKVAQLREENLRRMQGLAGATGAPSSTGSAAQSSGPSASWAGRVRARVKPNIVFSDDVPGNPEAVVQVRLAPDGSIIAKRVVKSSGVKSWDEAVLRALDKTEVLPRDVDGRVPSPVELVFRPKD